MRDDVSAPPPLRCLETSALHSSSDQRQDSTEGAASGGGVRTPKTPRHQPPPLQQSPLPPAPDQRGAAVTSFWPMGSNGNENPDQ
uniref:Engrailed n=1 Tax=Knipowitschia caucasica TaxID=637954 RepID=A0AAV2LDJ4_KNICA